MTMPCVLTAGVCCTRRSSKYGSYSMDRVASLERFQTIVTDDGLPEAAAAGTHLVLGDAAGQ